MKYLVKTRRDIGEGCCIKKYIFYEAHKKKEEKTDREH